MHTPHSLRTRSGRRSLAATAAIGLALGSVWSHVGSGVVAAPPATVIDDFEDGDTSDWGFFGGNAAGGGGGPATDRPQEGNVYFSTGWGGEGTASGFYGGAFKNFDNAAQVAPPADPWFNVWVLNQSDATVDEYTLELTIREDLDGNGWTNGAEDSFRLDTAFSSAAFDDQWTLVSAPLSSLIDLGTGGDGTFNGNLDEVVIVIAGVSGANPSVVEVDFDQFAFSSGGPLDGDPGDPGTPSTIVDDFENGVAPGTPCAPSAPPLNFCTFNGAGSSIAISNPATPPAPVLPEVGTPNNVLQMDVDVTSFAGFIRGFEDAGNWVSQDWSTSEGFSMWFHGTGSGTSVFIDILENRNPGSTTDDAERWTVAFDDDFVGWQLLEFPFSSFTRKAIGNGAPNDGFDRFEVHGWAIGTLGTGGPLTYYVDEVSVYGVSEAPELAVNFALSETPIPEGTTGDVAVTLNRPIGADDPAQVSVDFATGMAGAIPGEEFSPTSGTFTFTNAGPTELTFPIETFDNSKFTGDRRIVLRLSNPVGVELGTAQAAAVIVDDDPFDPKLLDDFEQGAFLWDTEGFVELDARRVSGERPGQDAFENIGVASVPESGPGYDAQVHDVIDDLEALLPASTRKNTRRIEKAIARLTDSIDPIRWNNGFFLDEESGDRVFNLHRLAIRNLHRVEGAEEAATHEALAEIVAIDGEIVGLLLDVALANGADDRNIAKAQYQIDEAKHAIAYHHEAHAVQHLRKAWRFVVRSLSGLEDVHMGSLVRDFPIGQDWTGTQSLDFWFNGTGSGEEVTVNLKDNRAPDPGPSGWSLAWADEFDDPAGTPPNPANWGYELGDGTLNGIPGWGNSELQYYTDDPENASTDGAGNLVVTLDEADSSLGCYYGPCEYESARLVSKHKAEFAYGRIESRLLVPDGGDGLWPALWSLGTDISYNPWPAAGEIDFMEYVSRLPNEIFGTIHGPGYNGGNAFGDIYDFGEPVYNDYHTFVTEWEPNKITWYVDGIQYHQAEPGDVPGPWVFEKPFFLLLNFAIGGNFGGPVDPANTYPQEYLLDYIRVYQGPDTAERFETTFVDSMAGWQQVSIPVTDFVRSADQPAGAPDDGLGLDDVWGYGFDLPYPAAGEIQFDLVRRTPVPPPTSLVVTSLTDSGPGSLREALSRIADGGTITFDPALAGGKLTLTSGQLMIDRSVTVDASAAAPVTISAGGTSRVVQVGAGIDVSMSDLIIADGAAAPQGGGVLNAGTLSLDRVTVTENQENSAGPANFQFGGAGIYNGDGAVLNLTNSTVSKNTSVNQPAGGVYGSFFSTVNVTNSTISGNVSGDVAGGLRTLGNADITGSTISGNTSTAWHGGGIFATDGTVTIVDTEIVDNVGAPGTAGGLMVATFGAPVTVTLQDSTVTGNVSYGCQVEGGDAAVLTSLGGNTFSDASCNPTGDDVVLP